MISSQTLYTKIGHRYRSHWATTVIIGAGHNGLAMSHTLSKQGIDHVVLEKGDVGNSWRKERWDSLKLLTPDWQCQLPGYRPVTEGNHNYLTCAEFVRYLEEYQSHLGAPIEHGVEVLEVSPNLEGFCVSTNRGVWHCRTLVVASGAFQKPSIPSLAKDLPRHIEQFTSLSYKRPQQLKDGPVLVVGASATGLQLANEIQDSGRQVTLSVGEHLRLPRRYRGKDVFWWLDKAGVSDELTFDSSDLTRLKNLPSPQLIGDASMSIYDLNYAQSCGVQLAGRLAGIANGKLQFSGGLENLARLADLKMQRLLKRFDEAAESLGRQGCQFSPKETYQPTEVKPEPPLQLPLNRFKTIIWACGLKPDYHWLKIPTLDRKGRLQQTAGVCHYPGLYCLGLPFMRTRKSGLIHGAKDDTAFVGAAIKNYLSQQFNLQVRRG